MTQTVLIIRTFKLKIHKVVNNFVDCGVRGIDKPGTIRRVSTVGDSLAHIQEVGFNPRFATCFIFGYFSGLGWSVLQETHQVESKITVVEL